MARPRACIRKAKLKEKEAPSRKDLEKKGDEGHLEGYETHCVSGTLCPRFKGQNLVLLNERTEVPKGTDAQAT